MLKAKFGCETLHFESKYCAAHRGARSDGANTGRASGIRSRNYQACGADHSGYGAGRKDARGYAG